jgi:hypothetical protein
MFMSGSCRVSPDVKYRLSDREQETRDRWLSRAFTFPPEYVKYLRNLITEVVGDEGGVGGGGITELEDWTSGGDAAKTFTIPSGYHCAQILGLLRGTTAAATFNVHVTFNADTGTNYDYRSHEADSVPAGSAGAAQAQLVVPGFPANNAAASAAATLDLRIPFYTDTTFHKSCVFQVGMYQGATGDVYHGGGSWRSTSAVTSITLTPSAGNFASGSRLTLYGIG